MGTSSVAVVGGSSLGVTDAIIAIIGATGTGKSTFIESVLGRKLGITGNGAKLGAYTKEITAYRMTLPRSQKNVVLIDTPGYGSRSTRSDTEVLEALSEWLPDSHTSADRGSLLSKARINYRPKNTIPLSGILYMHRISDNPNTFTPLKNFENYTRLCGGDALAKLVLVTTNPEGGESGTIENLSTLRMNYNGLRIEQFDAGNRAHETACDILTPLINAQIRKLSLAKCLAEGVAVSPIKCRSLLCKVASNTLKRDLLCTLRNDDAQVMIDYISLELFKQDLSKDQNAKQQLSLLCKLAKSSRRYPQRFLLSGIRALEFQCEGGYAVVRKGVLSRTNETVAIKSMLQWRLDTYKAHVAELINWAHLSHPNILPFYGVWSNGLHSDSICIISPWMDNGTLHEYTKGRQQCAKLSLLLDVVEGLLYLHKLDIVHGDLKGLNILVSKDPKALITDFGISSNVTTDTRAQTRNIRTSAGSVTGRSERWIAPELARQSAPEFAQQSAPELGLGQKSETGSVKPSKASDIWAFGSVVYEIISEKLPYDEIEDRFVMPAIAQGRLPGKPDGGAGYGMPKTSLPWRLAERCWKPRPNERPTCREVHAFFTRECQISEEPECTDEVVSEARHRFWEGDKKRPKVEVNWSYVHFLLDEVSTLRTES